MSEQENFEKPKSEIVNQCVEARPLPDEEPAISADLALTKEDIIAIKVAELEDALANQKDQLARALKENKAAQQEINIELQDSVAAFVKEQLEERTNALASDLHDLGLRVETNYSFNFTVDKIHYSIQAQAKDNQGRAPKEILKGLLSINGKYEHCPATIHLQGKLEGLREEHNELTEQMLETRKRLQELPRTERQARAALAKTILSRTERGKSLLAELSNNIDLKLPMLNLVQE